MKPTPRLLLLVLSLSVLAGLSPAHGQPSFSKIFLPDAIGPGSVSTLRFDIVESGGQVVTDLAFVDVLPAAVTIATPSRLTTDCSFVDGGGVSALDGGSTLSMTGAVLGPLEGCQVSVDVTSGTPGTHMNVSGDLTSSAGNSGAATDDLEVAADRPGFSKSFSPSSVSLGARSTLTFTIDNSLNPDAAFGFSFFDNLPLGMKVADPANVSNSCAYLLGAGPITATPGTDLISSSSASAVDAGQTCAITVDVVTTGAGSLDNSTSEFTSIDLQNNFRSSGKANATLESTVTTLAIAQQFVDDPVPAGGSPSLQFTITNFDRNFSASNVSVSESLGVLIGLAATSLPLSDPCGLGSSLVDSSSGQDGSQISLIAGSVAPGASCVFSVPLAVPLGAASGSYPFLSTAVTGDIDGAMVVGNQASDLLFVQPSPIFSKQFIDDPVGTGGDVTLRYTLSNTSSTSATTAITFEDDLSEFLQVPLNVVLPSSPCGAGSTMSVVFPDFGREAVSLSGGRLEPAGMAGDRCTFDVVVTIPKGLAGGVYDSTSGPVVATVDGASFSGASASDSLSVVAPPQLSIEFTDDPVAAGGTVTLEFTLSHDLTAAGDAVDVVFTDDLSGTLPGLVATGLPLGDLCGSGNGTLVGSAGDSLLTTSGVNLTPGQECTFSVTLNVPAGASVGTYSNETSDVGATVLGTPALGPPASDELEIPSVVLDAEFLPASVLPGALATLRFTLENRSATQDATSIAFNTHLSAALSGLVAEAPLPTTTSCGAGSSIIPIIPSFLIFSGGELMAGTQCSFDVAVRVPLSAADGFYDIVTTAVSASVGGNNVSSSPATASFEVSRRKIELTKEFTDDPIAPGTSTNLRFTLTNLDSLESIDSIAFTDDLDAALSGSVASGLPLTALCNGTGSATGTAVVTVADVVLAPGASCTFDITVDVPETVSAGESIINVTSDVTGSVNGVGVEGLPATAELLVDLVRFEKTFSEAAVPGGAVTLTFTMENSSSSGTVTGLAFSDDLDTFLSGATASNLPTSPCGPGSDLTGSTFLSLTGAELGPGASCTFDVTLVVPGSASIGEHVNTTTALTSNGLVVASAAVATLTILDVQPPVVTGISTRSGELASCSTLTQVTHSLNVTISDDSSAIANADDPANYLLVGSGPDGEFDTLTCGSAQGDDLEVSILGVGTSSGMPNSVVASLYVEDSAGLERGLYRLLVCDGIQDAAGNALDGDEDLLSGGDFELSAFRSDPLNLLANGHFDNCPVTLAPWGGAATPPNVVLPGTAGLDDSIGSTFSASAQFDSEADSPSQLSQCATVAGDQSLSLEATVRLQALVIGAAELTYGCEFYDELSCAGASVGSSFTNQTFAFSGPWFDQLLSLTSPADAMSALCSFEVERVGADDTFSLFLDRLFLGAGVVIFEDGFETGDTSTWFELVVP